MIIYAISGLGADERVFQYLALDYEIIVLPWLKPVKKESLQVYAQRMCGQVDISRKFGLMGVSFGGMIAVEMTKLLSPEFTILISSAEKKSDLKKGIQFFKGITFIEKLPPVFFNLPKFIAYWLFGTKHKVLLKNILDDSDPRFTRWAIQGVLSWNNEYSIPETIRIHGDRDRIISVTINKNTNVIPGGGHFMIVDRASEVSKIINAKIRQISGSN